MSLGLPGMPEPGTAFDMAFGLITALFGDEATADPGRLMASTKG